MTIKTISGFVDRVPIAASDSDFLNEQTKANVLSTSNGDRATSHLQVGGVSTSNETDNGKEVGVKVDPRTGEMVVVVYSKEDKRIIEEIPPEAARELSLQLEKLTGLLIDRYE